MSLIYRGCTAKPSDVVETVDTGLSGQFRGQSFPIKSINTIAHRAFKLMQYRGVNY